MITFNKLLKLTLGKISIIRHEIKLTTNIPIQLRPFSIPINLVNSVKREIKILLDLNIIKKSNSAYASPAFPLIKKNNSIRLAIKYQKLNSIVLKDPFPFHDLKTQLLGLKNAKIFRQTDLNTVYYQIPIKPTDIYLFHKLFVLFQNLFY